MLTSLLVVIVLLLLIGIGNANLNLTKKKKEWDSHIFQLQDRIQQLEKQLVDANTRIQKLSKYQQIVDVENEVIRLLAAAEAVIDTRKEETNAEIAAQTAQFQKERADALAAIAILKQAANEKKAKIEADYEAAILRAVEASRNIVLTAEEKAREMGTYTVEEARMSQATLTAVQNQIDGYGDKYLKSSYSLLDELAEQSGHKAAGEKLKAAREVTRVLIKNDKAAVCSYIEAERRSTAINFVLDAFNGKVEVIFGKIKKDNYGTLEQQIKDAFQIVNTLGRAFRNAAITQEYLVSRLEELKWAVAVQELKWQEAEEQRLIRERIREEEKALKEYEKAMREAQKEEDTLKRLIEKAQKEVQGATDAQRLRYEEKLRELENKLHAAEEKNQRALSMAQQTKSGNVYIISNIGSFGEDVFKVGMTRRLEPLDRVRELGDASVPFEFDVHAMIYSDDAPRLERELHKKFLTSQINKMNPRKEFFRLGLSDIREAIERMGINVNWTMTAEAKQYRESLALEKELAQDAAKRAAWEQQQIETEKREQLLETEAVLAE